MSGRKRNRQRHSGTRDNIEPQPTGRLIGWLVSYGLEKDGYAHEIRSGRCLISSNNFRNQQVLLLNSQDVSNPHAALKASSKHTLFLQDVFSAHGTYLRRSDSQDEVAVEGQVDLRHGDWIRVGKNTRFQVCLIDGPSK
ncbi:MAG: FHA domain-containing protein [Bdellovibrionales bacterium]|nr:FHA domain-containing protein [Bdellovibrionales bacterium]